MKRKNSSSSSSTLLHFLFVYRLTTAVNIQAHNAELQRRSFVFYQLKRSRPLSPSIEEQSIKVVRYNREKGQTLATQHHRFFFFFLFYFFFNSHRLSLVAVGLLCVCV
jgi:hypothetical protein